jgi:hypothetical protein
MPLLPVDPIVTALSHSLTGKDRNRLAQFCRFASKYLSNPPAERKTRLDKKYSKNID